MAMVASRAGVSKTTVSHALSGNGVVSPATKERILEAIAELDYQPNGAARALRLNQTHTVTLIVPDLVNTFFAGVAAGLQDVLFEAGYLVFVAASGSDPALERMLLTESARRRVDALVVSACALDSEEFQRLHVDGIPIVGIGTQLTSETIDVVTVDDRRVAYDAVHHLYSRGHRRIAAVTGPIDSVTSRARLAGYREACYELGIQATPDLVRPSDFTREGGRIAMASLLDTPELPSAVYVANDLMAVGVFDTARREGLVIPDDLAVVGTDDVDLATLLTPQLTSVRIPTIEMGRTAGRLLLERLKGTAGRPRRTVLLEHTLMARASS